MRWKTLQEHLFFPNYMLWCWVDKKVYLFFILSKDVLNARLKKKKKKSSFSNFDLTLMAACMRKHTHVYIPLPEFLTVLVAVFNQEF